MNLTKKLLSVGLILLLALPLTAMPLNRAAPAEAAGQGIFSSFTTTSTTAVPGSLVTFTYDFIVTGTETLLSGYIEIYDAPAGSLIPYSLSPTTFTNKTPGSHCLGTATYRVSNNPGSTILVNATFFMITETGTVAIPYTGAPITITIQSQLSIEKTTTATTENRGDEFSYKIVVRNTTGATARSVLVQDTLDPLRLEYKSSWVSPATGTTTLIGNTVHWNLGDVISPSQIEITLWVKVKTTSPTGAVNNSASISATGMGVSTGAAPAVIILEPQAAFQKTVDKSQAAPGDILHYEITFKNPTGSPTVYSAYITDFIPAYTAVYSAYGGTISGNTVSWSVGTIPPGGTLTRKLDLQIFTSLTYGTIVPANIAQLSGTNLPQSPMTASSPQVTVLPNPFVFTKTITPSLVQPGQQVAFSIYYKNNSGSQINAVTITDVVDSRITNLQYSGVAPSIVGNTLTWSLGNLAAGASGTVSFLGTISAQTPAGTEISNTAKIKGDGTAEMTSTAKVLVAVPSSLTLTKAVNPANILPGGTVSFTLTFGNPTNNPTIPSFTITDTLPGELNLQGATQGYTATGSVLTWTIYNLAPGGTGTLTLAATVSSTIATGTAIANQATLQFAAISPVTATATFTVGQLPASPLKISKIATADSVQKGEYITYIITYANGGNTILNGVKIEESIPANTTFLNGNPTPIVDTANNKVVWDTGELAPGANGTILAQFTIPATVPDGTQIANTVLGKVSGYQDAVTSTVYVTVGPVLHNAYITGYPDGNFQPEKAITRAEIATILSRILNLGQSTAPSQSFSDLKSNHWAYGYVNAIVNAGIMNGYPDGTFGPDRPITRAELSTVMVRVRGLFPIMVAPPTFPDIAGHWAAGYIESAQRAMFITGYPSGDFRPDRSITRAETVTLINRSFGRGPLVGANVVQSFPDVPANHWAFSWVAEAAKSHSGVHSSAGTESLINYL